MLVAISVCHGAAVDAQEWLMKLPMASGLEDDELGVEVDDGVVVLWQRRHGGDGEVTVTAAWNLPFASAPSPRSNRV